MIESLMISEKRSSGSGLPMSSTVLKMPSAPAWRNTSSTVASAGCPTTGGTLVTMMSMIGMMPL
jgi:hypothetical protein